MNAHGSQLQRLCASGNALCTGLLPCEECHKVRTAVLAHALIQSGYTDRRRVQMFLQTYGMSMDTVRRQVAEQLAQQPTLNGAGPGAAPPQAAVSAKEAAADAQLEGLNPAELRILRSRFGGDELAMRKIDAVIVRKERELEASQAAEAAMEEAAQQPEDAMMQPMSGAELATLMQQAQAPAPQGEAEASVQQTRGPETEEVGAAVAAALDPSPSPEPRARPRLLLREPRRRRPARSDESAGEGEPQAAVKQETVKETAR